MGWMIGNPDGQHRAKLASKTVTKANLANLWVSHP